MLIQFYFDGAVSVSKIGCDMGIGVAVFVNNEFQEELSKFVFIRGDEESSNNVAEWLACVEALKLVNEYKEQGDVIEVYSDSQLISRQYNGDYEIKQEKFRQYYRQAIKLANQAGLLSTLKIKWIPRELNKEADRLSKIALRQLKDDQSTTGIQEVSQLHKKKM